MREWTDRQSIRLRQLCLSTGKPLDTITLCSFVAHCLNKEWVHFHWTTAELLLQPLFIKEDFCWKKLRRNSGIPRCMKVSVVLITYWWALPTNKEGGGIPKLPIANEGHRIRCTHFSGCQCFLLLSSADSFYSSLLAWIFLRLCQLDRRKLN